MTEAAKKHRDEFEPRFIEYFKKFQKANTDEKWRLFVESLTNLIETEERLKIAITVLEAYAMINETFPEYGDVARETLAKIRGE